jgi:DNA polymerase-3 subunit alpha
MPVNAIPKSGEIVSAFQEADKSGKYLSELGILKLDILKLTTLNITQDTIRMVKENEGIDIQKEIDHIENHFKDPALYEDIKGGMNHGVFQFESDGMNVLLRDLDVDRFEELAAANALYRPGAKNAIPEFVANKFEKDKITYPHPLTEDALKETNGLLVFQEQMMFIAKAVGGMSLGEGDNLRRAMEKAAKIIEKEANKSQLEEKEKNDPNYLKFKELWGQFLDGAKKNGLNEKEVDNIRDYLLKYLGYSFNKSHSVSYAYIAMQTLYLKHYHPSEFYCALLNHSKGSGPKEEQQEWLFRAIASAMAKGIKVLPPSKKAAWDWKVTGKNEITAGFSTINGFGDVAYEELVRLLKEKGKTLQSITVSMFFSLPFSKYNKSAFEASLKAGVFDDWSKSREYLKYLKSKKNKKPTQNQTVLFDIDEISSIDMSKEKNYETTSDKQKEEEFKEACGFSLLELNRISKIKQQIQKKTSRQKKPVYAITEFEEEGNYYFILNDFQIKKSLNGNEYVEMLVGDGIKSTKIRAFAEMKDRVAPFLERKAVYMSQFMKNEKGYTNFKRGAKFKKIIEANSDEIIIEKQNQPAN